MALPNVSYRLSCDIGGTFTDVALIDDKGGGLGIAKVLTTPSDPSRGVLAGVRTLLEAEGGRWETVSSFVHATTLVVNAIVERKGARTALIATEGFRDVIELRRHLRVSTYEMWNDPPEPLVPRQLRLPIRERTYSDGRILRGVDGEEVRRLAEELRAHGVESVAIALLHSYVNPANEQETARFLEEFAPELLITCSSSVLREYMEYERTSTTVLNAYVRPIIQHYLKRLHEDLAAEGLQGPLLITLSNGGLASTQTASAIPVRIMESGPAGGAIAALEVARLAGLRDVLSFDMGGTTAKGCFIRGGELPLTSTLEVARAERFQPGSGYPIAIPSVDLIEVGAGGGSVAQINSLGMVEVGPQSAGAHPGPICYGFGGQEPTVTDADLILGYLNPEYFLGGEMRLDVDAARRGLQDRLSSPLERPVLDVAWTVHDVVNENMAAAVKMHVIERGGDPRGAALVAFGGAGPLHAYHLARKVGTRIVVVPNRAGVMSAVGLLAAPIAFDLSRTYRTLLDELDSTSLEEVFGHMEEEVTALLRQVDSNGRILFSRALDICHHGQGYQVTVPLPHNSGLGAAQLLSFFASAYKAKHGYFYEDVPAEIVTARIRGEVERTQVQPKPLGKANSTGSYRRTRLAYSGVAREVVEHGIYRRGFLAPGEVIRGPALIEERESTILVDTGGEAQVDDFGNLIITVGTT